MTSIEALKKKLENGREREGERCEWIEI